MAETPAIPELTAEEVTLTVDPQSFGFETTAELEPLAEIVGQPRAMRALDLATGLHHPNYHIYVAGLVGTGNSELIKHEIRERISEDSVPPDWVYINNFAEPDRPLSVSLPPGNGSRLRSDMEELVTHLQESLPKAFKEEDFGQEKERLRVEYSKKGEALFQSLQELAEQHGIAVQQLPDGQIMFVPSKDGRPMTPDEVEKLTPEEMKELESHQSDLIRAAGNVLQQQEEIQRQLSTDVREVARRFANRLIEPLIGKLKEKYDSAKLCDWLDQLHEHILSHINRFRDLSDMPPQIAGMLMGEKGGNSEERFLEYRVNLAVDNSQLEKPPVVIEQAPNYRNLFGTIERVVDREGRVITNFTRIKAGSLLKANGGYLVVNLMDAMLEPFVWKELKRTLKSQSLEIQIHDPFSIFTVSSVQPEPIPLTTKLVAIGAPLVYHLLYLYDEDFREIFRVKADFDSEVDRNEESGRIYGRLLRQLSDDEKLSDFNAEAVAELVRVGSRMADHQQKVTAIFSHVSDVAREANFWARRDGAKVVEAKYIRQAVSERIYRSDLIAEKTREVIADGTLLIDVDGTRIGHINALSVANLGDFAFGRPCRMTASVGVGATGIVNIEREARLSGRTYDKGLLILEGVLRNRYAGKQPLALSASIAMEQSYGGIDGDSASVAELLCLMSALARVPLRQDLAVTGSINQSGDVQAIGGVNEKIEGFYDVCNERTLTGTQGVCIPASNVKNLLLRPDVVAAIREGQFHVWAITHIDQAIELFTGMPAGEIDEPHSFHSRVRDRITEITRTLRQQKATDGGHPLWVPGSPSEISPDPRPRLPGRE